MTAASVSIVLPCLADTDLLQRCLPPLTLELEARSSAREEDPAEETAAHDEIIVVDDSGEGVLADWVEEHHPSVQVVATEANLGFAAALLAGARAARGELLLALNPDVVPRPGFLAPLVAALDDPGVAVASPRVLLDGAEDETESRAALCIEDGRLVVVQRPVDEGAPEDEACPAAFAVGGAMLVRCAEFLEREGFDPLFVPFYFEDVDFGLEAWRAGRRVVEVPSSVVEHHHRGTIGRRVPDDLVQAAIEKNRLLVLWKHLDTRRDAHDHLAALWRDALDAAVSGRRAELVWMALALEQLEGVNAARAKIGARRRSLAEVLRVADPLSAGS